MEGQVLKWVGLSRLLEYDFPAANAAIIAAIKLPECYLITGTFTDQKNFIWKLKYAL
jgi:8-oxo-dGTP diphosphatase